MNDQLELILKRLAKRRNTLTVFNPYRVESNLENLRCYFDAVFNQSGPRIMLVGEAPGFKGCRLTGVPFSSVTLLREAEHPFLQSLNDKLVLPEQEVAENTASIVWRYLLDKSVVPLFWNSFPYHPHPSRIQKKNRAPKKAEIEEGAEILRLLVDIYQPDAIAGVGRAGAACTQKVFPEQTIQYIRHPSYGGKNDFIKGMDKLFT